MYLEHNHHRHLLPSITIIKPTSHNIQSQQQSSAPLQQSVVQRDPRKASRVHPPQSPSLQVADCPTSTSPPLSIPSVGHRAATQPATILRKLFRLRPKSKTSKTKPPAQRNQASASASHTTAVSGSPATATNTTPPVARRSRSASEAASTSRAPAERGSGGGGAGGRGEGGTATAAAAAVNMDAQLNRVLSSNQQQQQQQQLLHPHRHPLSGQLSKYTNVMKGWQYRWFAVDAAAGTFSYYLCESDETGVSQPVGQAPRGQAHLANAVVCPSDEDSRTFTVSCASGDVLKLRATDARARQEWVDGLRAIAECHTLSMGSTTLAPRESLAASDALGAARQQLNATEQCNAALARAIENAQPPLNATDPDLLMLKALSAASTHCLLQCLGLLQRHHEFTDRVAVVEPVGIHQPATSS